MSEPLEWSVCPICNKKYTFTRCRVTKGDKNWCLACGTYREKFGGFPSLSTGT